MAINAHLVRMRERELSFLETLGNGTTKIPEFASLPPAIQATVRGFALGYDNIPMNQAVAESSLFPLSDREGFWNGYVNNHPS